MVCRRCMKGVCLRCTRVCEHEVYEEGCVCMRDMKRGVSEGIMVCESVYHRILYLHMVYIIMFSAYHLSFDVFRGCIYFLHAFRVRNIA